MDQVNRTKHLLGYNTIDCCVRDKNIFYFVLRENYNTWDEAKKAQAGWDGNSGGPSEFWVPKRILNWYRDETPDQQWVHDPILGLELILGETCQKPKPQFVGVAGLDVYQVGSGEGGLSKIPLFDDGGPFWTGVYKLKQIDGWVYGCGGSNCVGKRFAQNDWRSVSDEISRRKVDPKKTTILADLDGFNENDIYCVGKKGHAYHHNGKLWKKLAMPTNIDFQSVVCAGDGNVYISGMHGAVFKGRGEKWKRIFAGDPVNMVLGFTDMVWYQDRVWCTSDYGLWTIKDDKVTEADVPRFVRGSSGHLHTADGVLLLAGYGGASFLENGKWENIY